MSSRIDIYIDDLLVFYRQNPALNFLDIRSPAQFARGHIPGSRSLPLEELMYYKDEDAGLVPFGKEENIFVICGSGDLSFTAALRLEEMGFAHCRSLAGGLAVWEERGLPLEK